MTDRELMQMALDALELHGQHYPHMVKGYTLDAAEALRAALATEQELQEDDLSEIANLLPNCAVVRLDNKAFLVQPKTKESKQQWETRRKQIDGYFAVSQKVLAQPEPEPVATLFGSLPVYDVPPEQEPMACIVKGCSNHRHEGKFVGDLCDPCHTFITTGEGKYSQAYRNSQREWQGLTDEEIDQAAWPHFIGNILPSVKLIVRHLEAKLKEKNHD